MWCQFSLWLSILLSSVDFDLLMKFNIILIIISNKLTILFFLFFGTSQAPEAHEVGTRKLGVVQGGGAAVARGQPAGQTAARRRCTDRSDILLPSRVWLPAEKVAEEADALTKTPPLQPTPPPPRHRPSRRA